MDAARQKIPASSETKTKQPTFFFFFWSGEVVASM